MSFLNTQIIYSGKLITIIFIAVNKQSERFLEFHDQYSVAFQP